MWVCIRIDVTVFMLNDNLCAAMAISELKTICFIRKMSNLDETGYI